MKNIVSINPNKNRSLFLSIAFIILFCFSLSAQRKFKDYLITGSSMFVSGMLDGTIESISFHYDNGFKTRFPKINDQFWNPSISWTNKYKNGNCEMGPKFMGSTNIFVCTTDAYHLLRTAKRTVDCVSLAYYVNKTRTDRGTNRKKWKSVAKDFLILSAIRCIGFNVTYNLLFNPQKNYYKN